MRTYSLKKQNSSINKDKRRNCIFANFANVLVLFSAVATAASGIVVFCKRGLPWLRCTKTLFATIFLIKKSVFCSRYYCCKVFFLNVLPWRKRRFVCCLAAARTAASGIVVFRKRRWSCLCRQFLPWFCGKFARTFNIYLLLCYNVVKCPIACDTLQNTKETGLHNMKKQFEVPKRKQPVWKHVSKLLKRIYKKPEIVNLNDSLPQKAIFVANHCAMNGPLVYALHLPVFHITWGAHQMMGNYKMRFHYLRDVYFIQKRGMKKFWASILASFEAAFSIFFYRGIKTMPTFTDGRMVSTIKNSITCLDNDVSVLIFPEDSSEGYHEILTAFFSGFVSLAERYHKTHGEHAEIYPMYYSQTHNKLVIGKPQTLAHFPEMNRRQIAEEFRKIVNSLYTEHICSGEANA